jgi:hypothetical protein
MAGLVLCGMMATFKSILAWYGMFVLGFAFLLFLLACRQHCSLD